MGLELCPPRGNDDETIIRGCPLQGWNGVLPYVTKWKLGAGWNGVLPVSGTGSAEVLRCLLSLLLLPERRPQSEYPSAEVGALYSLACVACIERSRLVGASCGLLLPAPVLAVTCTMLII